MAVSPTSTAVQTDLRSFLLAVLGSTVEVVEAQDNRVPEPVSQDFVVMTPLRRPRLATNLDAYVDVQFTASISGQTMSVTAVAFGALGLGSTVFGTGVAANTTIQGQLSGSTGGTGAYAVSVSQVAPPQTMAAGTNAVTQKTEVVYQLDFHSTDSGRAADMAQTVSTLFRDDYAVEYFAQNGTSGAVPLYADDPAQRPFFNDQEQVEFRWVVEARMQADQVVTVGQQFAAAVKVGLINVDATYPP